MKQSKGNPGNRYWYGAIKLLIAAVAFIFIYRQVISRENFTSIIQEYKTLFTDPRIIPQVMIVVLLMAVNWSIEALKWKLMMRKLEAIPFHRAFAAVFSGLTVSFFTPNRIGEYAGRIFHLRSANRIKSTLVTILENLSQLIITLVVGSVSLLFYLDQYVGLDHYIQWVTGVLLVVFSATILFLFLEVPVLDQSILKIRRMRKLSGYLEVLSEYKKSELLVVLGLAFLRYLVFTFQFYLLLKIFGIHTGYFTAMLLINMVFFVMTLVPSFAWTEIGVRGAVAAYFLSNLTPDSLAILNASVSLWLINLVIPALLGIVFIFQFRFTREK